MMLYNDDYSAGIENIAYDAIRGLAAPMFLRRAKLKDFPWNGWLGLGTDTRPTAAWNPVASFTDDFGRLTWSAFGDPAVLPAPDDSGWTANRVSDVAATATRGGLFLPSWRWCWRSHQRRSRRSGSSI